MQKPTLLRSGARGGRDGAGQSRGVALGAVLAVLAVLGGLLVVRTDPRAESRFELSDGAAWLPSATLGGVSLLDGASGSIVTSLAVAAPGDDYGVVEWGTDALIVNRTAGTIGRLDGATWTIETGLVKFTDGGADLDLVANRSAGWLVRPGSVSPLDLESLETRSPMPVSADFSDGAVDVDGALLYASVDAGDPVRRITQVGDTTDVEGLSGPVAFADLGAAIAAVDRSDRSVWVSGHGVVCEGLEVPNEVQLHVAGADGSMVVVADSGGILAWEPLAKGCPDADDFYAVEPAHFATPAVTDGWAAIPDTDRGEVIVLDLERGEMVARATLEGVADGSPVELRAENGLVWFNDPASEAAGLIRRDGSVVTIVKYDLGAEDGMVAAPISADDDASQIEVAGIQVENPLNGDDPADQSPTPTTPTDPGAPETEPPATDTPASQPTGSQPEPSTPETTTPGQTDPGPTDPGQTTLEPPQTTIEPPGPTTPPSTAETVPGTDPTSTSSTTEPIVAPAPVEIRLAATAREAAVGDTITFQVIADNGEPNQFDFSTSPSNADAEPIQKAGVITYRFPTAGRYRVSAEACDADGNCDTATVAVDIVAGAVEHKAIIADPGTVTVGVPVQFQSVSQGQGIQGLRWEFGAGASPATSTANAPTVEWSTPGTKTVRLTIAGNGCAPEENCGAVMKDLDTTTLQVTVIEQAPPYAIKVSGPTSVEAGQSATYVASTTDPAGLPNPHWNIGGTDTVSQNGAETTVTWSTPGTYRVGITTDAGSKTGSGESFVTVTAAVPDATLAISCTPTSLQAGETAQCSETTATNVTGARWQVNYPVPSAGTTTGNSITYGQTGSVTVRRVAEHSVTGDTVTSNTVTLSFGEAPPVAQAPNVTLSGPTSLQTGEAGTWTLTNTGGAIDSASWSVTGGGLNVAGDQRSATRTFGNAGSYTINVTATGPGGTSQDSLTVVVLAPEPTVSLSIGCNRTTQEAGSYVDCSISGDASAFESPSWATTKPDPAQFTAWGYEGGYAFGSLVPGQVTVTATARHIATGQTVTSNTVSISFTAPAAEAAPSISISGPTMVTTGQSASYSFTNSGGSITSIEWQAGGQSPGSGQNYTVTWSSAQQVTLVVTVTGPGGTSSDSLLVTINDPAPSTTAPSTTAPSTTAPSTTAPSTTAPSTTAPSTTLP